MSAIGEEEEQDNQRFSDSGEGEPDDLQQPEPFDSSEEEEDDDEEEIQKLREGFIVDDEDEEGERKRHKKKHKRRHIERETNEDEGLLDEDDLDLLMENSGASRVKEKSKFKRLKRAAIEEEPQKASGLNDFFSDEEEEELEETQASSKAVSKSEKSVGRNVIDELDDFIEDDEFSGMDDDEREVEIQRRKQERLRPTELSGIDSEKVDELYDIFGDGDDYAWALAGEDEEGEEEDSRPQLQDIYEPEELKARMLTDGDKVIRDTDVPERYQELRKFSKEYNLNKEDFDFEKVWVSFRLSNEKKFTAEFDIEAFNTAVGDVLTFISKENLEVPFIHAHRRDYLLKTTITGEGDEAQTSVVTLLNEDDLWRILQLDIEFHSLLEKRKQVEHIITNLDAGDIILHDAFRNGRTISDFQDIHDYINFNYSQQLKDLGLKKAQKSTVFEKVKNDRLYELVSAVGIKVPELTHNFTSNTKFHPTKDYELSPTDLAEIICSDENSLYAKENTALEAAKRYYAEEISTDLTLRKYLRDIFENYSKISVAVTEQGRLKIDRNSSYADFKYAINLSVNELREKPDLFLRMLEAEGLRLIEIKIEVISGQDLLEPLFKLFESDGQSDIANDWNLYRRSILEIAFKKLLPLISLNIKEDLRRECEHLLFFQVRSEFLKKIDQAPFQPKREGKVFGSTPRVLAISPGNGNFGSDSIIGALLDEDGNVSDTYKFDQNPLISRDRLPEGEIAFEVIFADTIRETNPDVIVINGFNVKTHKLYTKVKEILENNRSSFDNDQLDIIFVNDEVAVRYQHSQKAVEEFPDKSTLVKYTIALARYAQSPLLEYVGLGDDITSLAIHKHQSLLPEDKLKDAINSAYVDIVNMVGVDINKAITHSYSAGMLPYVAGLGDRKASGLLKAVQQHPLFSRQALITNENIRIGPTIFLNCASFLRIPQHRAGAIRSDDEIEAVTLLDDTRIHPEDYALAEKMAADALDFDEDQIQELRDAPIGETIIDKLIERGPELLHTLVLEDYSRQLLQTYQKKKRATLQMISEELQEPFAEIRMSFKALQPSQIFETLTGESDATFYQGLVISVQVKRTGRYELNAVTSNQIPCIARAGDDEPQFDSLYFGQTVQAKLKSVDYENITAEITLNEREVKSSAVRGVEKRAGKWDFDAEDRDIRSERVKIEANQKKSRFINHPQFQNFTAVQAQNYLAPKQRGDYVIRPSSKGNNHISITWKVDNNLYQHIDVVEHDKENEYSLGRTLSIGSLKFQDLDEIIHEFIGKLVDHVNHMFNHDKFQKGSRNEVAQWLENYAKANPNRGSYAFAVNHKRPGYFFLLFKTNAKSELFSWNIKVVSEGYELNGYPYPTMTDLCNGFKTLINNKNRGQAPNPQSRYPTQNTGNRPVQGNYNNYNSGYGNNNYNNNYNNNNNGYYAGRY